MRCSVLSECERWHWRRLDLGPSCGIWQTTGKAKQTFDALAELTVLWAICNIMYACTCVCVHADRWEVWKCVFVLPGQRLAKGLRRAKDVKQCRLTLRFHTAKKNAFQCHEVTQSSGSLIDSTPWCKSLAGGKIRQSGKHVQTDFQNLIVASDMRSDIETSSHSSAAAYFVTLLIQIRVNPPSHMTREVKCKDWRSSTRMIFRVSPL